MRQTCLGVFLLIASQGCYVMPATRYVYHAGTINLPGPTDPGDVQVAIAGTSNTGASGGPPAATTGVDIQASGSPLRNLTVTGEYSQRYTSYRGSQQSANLYLPYVFGPFQGGYRTDLPADSGFQQYRSKTFEWGAIYSVKFCGLYFCPGAGLAGGNFYLQDAEYFGGLASVNYYLNVPVLEWYVQPAFYFQGRGADFAIGARLSWTRYGTVNTNYFSDELSSMKLNTLSGSTLYQFQPFAVLRIFPGTRIVRIDLQGSLNYGDSGNPIEQTANYHLNLSAAAGLDIYEIWRRDRAHSRRN